MKEARPAIHVRKGKVLRCPVCHRPRDSEYRPFCSARCRDVDLSRWLDGSYSVPIIESEDDGEGEG